MEHVEPGLGFVHLAAPVWSPWSVAGGGAAAAAGCSSPAVGSVLYSSRRSSLPLVLALCLGSHCSDLENGNLEQQLHGLKHLFSFLQVD